MNKTIEFNFTRYEVETNDTYVTVCAARTADRTALNSQKCFASKNKKYLKEARSQHRDTIKSTDNVGNVSFLIYQDEF